MKIKTSKLIGDALDWAVAQCEGDDEYLAIWRRLKKASYFTPSTDWAYGGPVIEREKITVSHASVDRNAGWPYAWSAIRVEGPAFLEESGPTPLIAVMRCRVASKLGDEVDVPDELVKGEMR